MPLDPHVQRFLQLLASADRSTNPNEPNPTSRRSGLAELMKLGAAAAPIAGHEDRNLMTAHGPLALRIYTPPGSPREAMPCLIYFHGGGLVAGSIATHETVARSLAHFGCCRIIAVEYRLAPENPFPAALDDALAAVRHVAANASGFGVDPRRLGICGDSAGGLLSAATCQLLTEDPTAPRLALQLLLCPILDLSRRSESRRAFANGYLVDERMIESDFRQYAPAGTQLTDPRVSPLRATRFVGLPRTIIHTAEFDPFRDEGTEYHQRLAEAESAVSYTCHVGMIHLFYALSAVIPHAQIAFEQIGGEIRAALDAEENCSEDTG